MDGLPKEWSLFLVYIYLCNTCWISVLQFPPVHQYWCCCGSSSWSIHLSAQIVAKVQSQWRKSSREFSAAKCPGINNRSYSLIKSLKILFISIVQQSTYNILLKLCSSFIKSLKKIICTYCTICIALKTSYWSCAVLLLNH